VGEAPVHGVVEALHARGLQTWLSHKDVFGGLKPDGQSRAGSQRMDRPLVVLSGASIRSRRAGTENLDTRRRERAQKRPIPLPIRTIDDPKPADLGPRRPLWRMMGS
jgi:hypothetical protein